MKDKSLFASLLFAAAALVASHATASAQGVGSEKSLRGLKGVDIVVEDADRFEPADGLSEKLIREDVAKKLGEAGIKILTEEEDAPGDPYLDIGINIWKEKDGSALVSINLKLKQEVALERDPSIGLSAVTWMESQLVTAGTSELAKAVREKLALMVEQFTAEYKEENQTSPASPPPTRP